jgi:hypothetical protein
MGRHAANAVRLQLIAHLMFLLCLVSLGFVDRGAVAQELVGQAPRHIAKHQASLVIGNDRYAAGAAIAEGRQRRTSGR